MSYGCDIPYLDCWKVSDLIFIWKVVTSCGYDIPYLLLTGSLCGSDIPYLYYWKVSDKLWL